VLRRASYPVVSGWISDVAIGDSEDWLVGEADSGTAGFVVGMEDGSMARVDETSGCFPGRGSVASPHFSPTGLSARP
jgi:hypothetical protein